MTPGEVLAHTFANSQWRVQAECRGARADHFSPVDGRGRVNLPIARRTAHLFCAVCPVIAECRAQADLLATVRLAPQELVQGGAYWPASNAENTTPIELLNDHDDGQEIAA